MTLQIETWRVDDHADATLVEMAFERIGQQESNMPASRVLPHDYVLDLPGDRVHVSVTVEGPSTL